ncbi:MAG: NAD-dependent epimerase/dehydratase family protein [Planctomycetota bacterium]|nr:NAD-dependent epimerase/dehydratase family protein [Planctomycetaceae bacterium]MDQ3331815.1 NAD-dependent epimerase/dehydratase family protein [Planctomycetota bacterium]
MELTEHDLVLVTGATGLVGSHVAERLRQLNVQTRAIVRSNADTSLLRSWGVEIVPGDLTDSASLASAAEGVTVVIHCAAKVGDWGPVEDYRKVNVEGLAGLLDAVQRPGVLKRFVHISSLGVYEARDHHGTDETTPPSLSGIDGYTRTKAESEKLVLDRVRQTQLPAVVLRPGFIYGPRDRTILPRILSRLKDGSFKYLGSGGQLLNNTYVGNVVEAVLLAIRRDDVLGEAFNITDDQLVTKRYFAAGIARRAGLPEPTKSVALPVAKAAAKVLEAVYRALGKKEAPLPSMATVKFLGLNLDYSIDKARNRLGYAPSITFDQGMDRTFAWLRAEGLA